MIAAAAGNGKFDDFRCVEKCDRGRGVHFPKIKVVCARESVAVGLVSLMSGARCNGRYRWRELERGSLGDGVEREE